MRNLKKFLALVLALMMVLSVMVTASAATFTDDADIAHKEAVEVMAAAGILNGIGDGSFNPTGTLDRASAAKLVAYLKLGKLIDLIAPTNTEFGDVKTTTTWASGFIGYLADEGIVTGDNNNNFNPTKPVEGYSLAKMILLALGYEEKGLKEGEESYVGNSWTVKVAIAIQENGLSYMLNGLDDVNLNHGLSREHAAQMVFNTLYGQGLLKSTYSIDTVPVVEGGLEGYKWVYTAANGKTVDVTDVVYTDVKVGEWTSGTTYADIAEDLGITKDIATAPAVEYTNTTAGNSVDLRLDYFESKTTVALASSLVAYQSLVTGEYKLMYTVETLAEASVAEEAVKSGTNKGKYAVTFDGSEAIYAEKDAYTDGATYLVVVDGEGNVLTVSVPETVEGKITGKGTNYVRVNGEKYTFVDTDKLPALNATKVLWLATDGSVLDCREPVKEDGPVVDTTETLVFVIGYYTVKEEGTDATYDKYGNPLTEAVADKWYKYAQVVTLDGEATEYLVEVSDKEITDPAVSGYKTDCALYEVEKVDDKTGVVTLANDDIESALYVEGKLSANAIKLQGIEGNYYYKTANYLSIVGTQDKIAVAEGTLAGAIYADDYAYAVYTTDKTGNSTISLILYWAPATYVAPVNPDVKTDMLVVADSTSEDLHSIVVKNEETGKDEDKTLYAHDVIIAGEKVSILADAETLKAGLSSYIYNETYSYYTVTVIEENAVNGALVTNVYGTLVTDTAELNDTDITGITVIDLTKAANKNDTKGGNGTIDVGEYISYLYTVVNGATVITTIYIVG